MMVDEHLGLSDVIQDAHKAVQVAAERPVAGTKAPGPARSLTDATGAISDVPATPSPNEVNGFSSIDEDDQVSNLVWLGAVSILIIGAAFYFRK